MLTIAVSHQRCFTHFPMDAASQIRTHDAQLFRDVFNARPEGQSLFVNPAFCAMLGFSEEELRNKTERKLTHAALANVSRKLIEAQEQERSRIGRELHDDIGQRLALLAVQLQQLQQDTLISPEVRSRMGEFQKQIWEISTDIQSLSHELHSARLQYMGIARAMRGFCEEFAEQQKVEIDFKAHDLPGPMSPDISLCLFRVLQEALHNSAKH